MTPKLSKADLTDLPLVERLLQLYLHDFSGFAGADSPHGLIGENGVFPYGDFPGGLRSFFIEDDRSAWLFHYPHPTQGNVLAGFALVNAHAPSGEKVDHVVAEFHILRKYRGIGLGRAAAHALFTALPGMWELGILDDNVDARAFWPKVVQSGPCHGTTLTRSDNDRWSGDIWHFVSAG